MTCRERRTVFPVRRALFGVGAALVLAGIAGCASATIEEAVPQAAAGSGPVSTVPAPETALDTGEYPNLNIPRRGETAQLSATERAAKAAELAAARGQTQQGQPVRDDIAQLKRLGATHTRQALQEIEQE